MNVIVTGAGKGLALEITRLHAKRGDRVYALAHSVTSELKDIVDNYNNVIITTVELASEAQIQAVLSDIEESSVDMLYNVAGIWYEEQAVGIEATDIDIMMQIYRINSIAPVCVMKYSNRLLKDGAKVINVSSEAGSIGACHRDRDYSYCMSKAALNMASVIFQNETKDRGIEVLCYHPGWLRTQMGGERAAASADSISALESAERLLALIFKEGSENINSMFFDYQNNNWPW